ncbi:MAG: ATP-binding protein [Acidobacteriota bacterium]|nr:ATP-binding protein [Acidobacteriota bacterium]
MPPIDSHTESERILIHAPFGRDAELIEHELRMAGFGPEICGSIDQLCRSIRDGAGGALVGDEALTQGAIAALADQLSTQPAWSDFPLLVMTSGGGSTMASRNRLRLLAPLGNTTLLERPLRPVTLVSSLRAALRARRHQYQLCRLLDELADSNNELKISNVDLIRVNRELEEFAYVASHDLKEPMRMINIYTQLILKNIDGQQELRAYGEFVRQGVSRMEALIGDLLTFSSTVHSERAMDETADLSVSLNQAVAVLQGRIEENGAVIHSGTLPEVRGEVRQLALVFQNLISNSIKYRKTAEPPEIGIDAEEVNGQWVIAVHDNGIGFEQQYAERIFGLFKRLHKDEYPGTGLGLSICQRIVERYGGRMWAKGKSGEGAVFYFALQPARGQP